LENQTENFEVERLKNLSLVRFAKEKLQHFGELCQSSDGFVYLKVSNDYIYELCPLIKGYDVEFPDYFSKPESAGAHVTVVYPEEWTIRNPLSELGKVYQFRILDLYRSKLLEKIYFILRVECPELKALRMQYGLNDRLNFHGYEVDFHITIAMGK
jgi:hypothetical protein